MSEQIRRGPDIRRQAEPQDASRTAPQHPRLLGRACPRFGALLLIGLLLASCGSTATGQGPAASGQVVIKASEWKFDPSSAQLAAGRPVTLSLQNQGKLEHNVKIAGLTAEGNEVQLDALAGQTASLTFTPGTPGTYQFFCTLPGHQEAGMKGQFVVVAK